MITILKEFVKYLKKMNDEYYIHEELDDDLVRFVRKEGENIRQHKIWCEGCGQNCIILSSHKITVTKCILSPEKDVLFEYVKERIE